MPSGLPQLPVQHLPGSLGIRGREGRGGRWRDVGREGKIEGARRREREVKSPIRLQYNTLLPFLSMLP